MHGFLLWTFFATSFATVGSALGSDREVRRAASGGLKDTDLNGLISSL